MSAWGISNFENDTALDWVNEIIQEKEITSLEESINSFLHEFSVECTSLMDCSKFLTIAETVAALIGKPDLDFPEELKEWVDSKCINVEQVTIDAAKKGVKLIMTDSEAKEMYLDSGYFKSWEKAQRDLIKRLSK